LNAFSFSRRWRLSHFATITLAVSTYRARIGRAHGKFPSRWWLPCYATIPLALLAWLALAGAASAHVKWFSTYDVAGAPLALENVHWHELQWLIGVSLLALIAGCLTEGTDLGRAMLRSIDRVTAPIAEHTETLFRAGTAFFFIAIWALGGIILTPELKADSVWIGAIQLGIAAGMLSRRTMPASAFGIAALFAIAVWNYGVFHLADYPVFLGVAAFLALTGLQKDFCGTRPIDVVRWSAGATLMWASVEKWAYPEWSYPMFVEHPNLAMGFSPEFFMRAAGAVEFALAFALLWTPMVRRFAAVLLTAMFVTAVIEFGKIDLIGHTLIVVVLVAIVGDRKEEPVTARQQWLLAPSYAAALALFMATYYVGHAVLYGSRLI